MIKLMIKPKSESKSEPKYPIVKNVTDEEYNKMIKYGIVLLKTPDNKEHILNVSRFKSIDKEKADKIIEKKEQIEEKKNQIERKKELKVYEYDKDLDNLYLFIDENKINISSFPKIESYYKFCKNYLNSVLDKSLINDKINTVRARLIETISKDKKSNGKI